MVSDHRHAQLDRVREALSVVAYPLQLAVSFPAQVGRWLSETLSSRQALLAENTNLQAQNLLLNLRLQKLAALERENMRLRELLDSSFKVGDRVLVAEVMAVDLAPFSREVTINKGGLDGVYVGQPLLNADGVMGQVVQVNPFSSNAMLITDPSHAIPVLINRSGLRSVAEGTGNALDLLYIPNNADVRVGDLLVSSGLGERFPPGYPVGVVTRVVPDPSRPFAQVQARPSAHLDSGREVLLVWSNNANPAAAARATRAGKPAKAQDASSSAKQAPIKPAAPAKRAKPVPPAGRGQ